MRIPRTKIEEDYTEVDDNGEEVKKKVERFQEIDIEDKVFVIPAVVGVRDYTIYAFNQSAPCLLYTSPSPRDRQKSRMPSSA